jgi:hypothetical protein
MKIAPPNPSTFRPNLKTLTGLHNEGNWTSAGHLCRGDHHLCWNGDKRRCCQHLRRKVQGDLQAPSTI